MKLYSKEKAKKIIKEKTRELTKQYLDEIKKNFTKTPEMPKLSPTSAEVHLFCLIK